MVTEYGATGPAFGGARRQAVKSCAECLTKRNPMFEFQHGFPFSKASQSADGGREREGLGRVKRGSPGGKQALFAHLA